MFDFKVGKALLVKDAPNNFGIKQPLSSLDTVAQKEISETHPPIIKKQILLKEFKHTDDKIPIFYLWTTYLSYMIILVVGLVEEVYGKIFHREKFTHLIFKDGYAPINSGFGIKNLKRYIFL